MEIIFEHSIKSPSASTAIIFEIPNGTKKFPKSHRATWSGVIYFIPLSVTIPNLSYNTGMLESCEIHPDLGCPLVTKLLEIPRRMDYLTQSYEISAGLNDSMNAQIGNLPRLS